jgi:hypothetical protein
MFLPHLVGFFLLNINNNLLKFQCPGTVLPPNDMQTSNLAVAKFVKNRIPAHRHNPFDFYGHQRNAHLVLPLG